MSRMTKWLAVVVLTLAVLGPATAQAEWYTANITLVGAAYNTVYIRFTDQGGAFYDKWTWCGADVTQCNRMMATALAAVQMGKPVMVYIDAYQNYPSIVAMYLSP